MARLKLFSRADKKAMKQLREDTWPGLVKTPAPVAPEGKHLQLLEDGEDTRTPHEEYIDAIIDNRKRDGVSPFDKEQPEKEVDTIEQEVKQLELSIKEYQDEVKRNYFEYDYQYEGEIKNIDFFMRKGFEISKQHTPAISITKQSDNEVNTIEQAVVKGVEFLEDQSWMPKDFFENVKVVPFHCAMDVINLMREEYANAGANHIKSTHVPIEEVVAKLDKLFIELLGVGDTDSAQYISNMIDQIGQLIKPQ